MLPTPKARETEGKVAMRSRACDFPTFFKLVCITSALMLAQVNQSYISPTFTMRYFPNLKKPMVVSLASLLVVLPGAIHFLPDPPKGASYEVGHKFVAWLSAPSQTTNPADYGGAFFPHCKPHSDWLSAMANGGRTEIHTNRNIWSPIALTAAMESDPVALMGMPEGTKRSVAILQLAKNIKAAMHNDPTVFRLLLLVPLYKFLQDYVVKAAVDLKNKAAPLSDAMVRRFKAINPWASDATNVDASIDTTAHVKAYHAFVSSPTGPQYAELMSTMGAGVDKQSGYQAHTYGEDYRPIFNRPVTPHVQLDGPAAPPAAPAAAPPGSPARPTAAAGATSRLQGSPGAPGQPKARRTWVDVTRGKVPTTPGTTAVARTQAPSTGDSSGNPPADPPAAPAPVPAPVPATPAAHGTAGPYTPPGYPYHAWPAAAPAHYHGPPHPAHPPPPTYHPGPPTPAPAPYGHGHPPAYPPAHHLQPYPGHY